jgi:hypothetical protein
MASATKPKRLTVTEKLAMVDNILDKELAAHKAQGWNKLDKTMKSGLLNRYVTEVLTSQHTLTASEQEQGQQVLQTALDRQQLTLVKEVVYDKTEKKIVRVPRLTFDPSTRVFTFA